MKTHYSWWNNINLQWFGLAWKIWATWGPLDTIRATSHLFAQHVCQLTTKIWWFSLCFHCFRFVEMHLDNSLQMLSKRMIKDWDLEKISWKGSQLCIFQILGCGQCWSTAWRLEPWGSHAIITLVTLHPQGYAEIDGFLLILHNIWYKQSELILNSNFQKLFNIIF